MDKPNIFRGLSQNVCFAHLSPNFHTIDKAALVNSVIRTRVLTVQTSFQDSQGGDRLLEICDPSVQVGAVTSLNNCMAGLGSPWAGGT